MKKLLRAKPLQNSFDWCFSTLGCPDYDLDQALKLADDFNIKHIEIRCLSGTVDICGHLEAYLKNYPDKVEILKKENKIIALDTSFGISANREADRELLIRTAAVADQFGSKYLRVFGGFDFKEKLTRERLKRAVDTINWFEQIRERNNFSCELILEVHDGFSSAERCLQLINAAEHDINILWDAHHSYYHAGEPFELSWSKLHKYIRYVHVKDGVKKDNGTIEASLPGSGTLPIKDLLKILRQNNFDGIISLEWEKYWKRHLPSLELALCAVSTAGWLENF